MNLFNKYFGRDEQKKKGELTVPQIMKFIHELSPLIDDSLLNKYENDYDYYDHWSEDEINKMELSEFRINILVHTIFGYAHNEHYNIQEHLVNMPSSYKESLYTESYWDLCSRWLSNRRVIDEIVKTTDIEYQERSILVIALYMNKVVHELSRYLTNGIREFVDKKNDIENISEFKGLYFSFNNPNEELALHYLKSNDYYGIDEEEVSSFAWSVRAIFLNAKELLSNGN